MDQDTVVVLMSKLWILLGVRFRSLRPLPPALSLLEVDSIDVVAKENTRKVFDGGEELAGRMEVKASF